MTLLNWLFGTKPHPLVGTRMHAWHWTQWGPLEVVGEVIEVGDNEIALDVEGDTVRVWTHDARPVGVALPIYGPEEGT